MLGKPPSITRTAGVTVSCVDTATQTDPVLITAAPLSLSYNKATTEESANSQREKSDKLTQKEQEKQQKADIKLKQNIRKQNILLGKPKMLVGWLFGFNGPFRQYFSLYRAASQREGERGEKIVESKNVQTTPTRTYCKHSRPLPYYHPNCRTPRHWKFTQNLRTTRPPPKTEEQFSKDSRPYIEGKGEICTKYRLVSWLGGFGFNGLLRQYLSLYRAVSQRDGEKGNKG